MSRTIKRDKHRPKASAAAAVSADAQPAIREKITPFLDRHGRLLAILLVAFASVRIASTYTVFNHVVDEPGHIECGMEWLEKGVYTIEAQHPPLARVVGALGPYLLGIRMQGGMPKQGDLLSTWEHGAKILYYGHHYDRTLAIARLGMLPFFWIACFAVYWWGSRHFSRPVAVIALFGFTFMPSILAHATFTTTDMALTAFMTLAFIAGLVWVEQPTPLRAVWFGLATGLMVLSKFSCLAFFPVAAALTLFWYILSRRPGLAPILQDAKLRLPTFALAVAVSVVIIWAGYRFSFGPVHPGGISVPAPELFRGIQEVEAHAERGHLSYLLGETRTTGFWDFYFVSIFFKTPIGYLVLLAIGAVLLFGKYPLARRLWIPFLFAAGILLVGMFSSINIGIRHVLPVYVGFSLMVAVAIVRMLEAGQTKRWIWVALGGITAWFALSSVLAHPDYLPYFNELAGSEPENILVDSDLDWGQDMKRLAARLKELHATHVGWLSSEWADFEGEHGFPHVTSLLNGTRTASPHPVPGWNAIGVNSWKMGFVTWPSYYKPKERVGKSILLWYFPENASQSPPPGR